MAIFKHKLLHYLRWKIFGDYPRLSYSRAGEDAILMEIFEGKNMGFFVDVGCYDPIIGSNTYGFYLNGWSGINIDPNERAIELFNKSRTRDINVHSAVDLTEGHIDYYSFNEAGFDQMNTISESFKEFAQNEFNLTVKSKTKVACQTLEHILDQYLPAGKTIDFLSIDVEGKDLEVVQSNNWQKYRPVAVVTEVTGTLSELDSFEITKFMKSVNYEPVAFNLVTTQRGNIFFKSIESK